MAGKIERNHWHPGFLGAMEIELIEYKSELEYEGEHQLSKEPIRMDLLVIKKDKAVVITNEIGEIFRQYNVFEFKSPDDGLTIDDFYKTISYALLYKASGKTVNAVPRSELTVTLMRDNRTDGLFETLEEEGFVIEEKHPGVYYVSGVIDIPMQILITSELNPILHTSLRLLTKRATEEDVERFITFANSLTEPSDRRNADALFQVSISANMTVYETVIRRDPNMCMAMKDLMKDTIEEEKQEAVDLERILSVRSLIEKLKLSPEKAMDLLNIPVADQKRYAARL